MSLDVIVTPRAEDDLRQSTQWWAENRDPEQAGRWWYGILEKIESLAENPDRCPLARENPKHPHELRELHFGLGSRPTHRILFTIRPDRVVIVAVRHAAQDDWNPEDE